MAVLAYGLINNMLNNPLNSRRCSLCLRSTINNAFNPIVHPMKVAYQGEPGAYSEKASRELLGPRILTLNYPSFEDVFKAVVSREADYAVVPIENSLGGSIHANFDLLLRYDLHIIAEHEFRVEHYLLALPGVKKADIKKVMSHPQALAQCDNYLRDLGYIPTPTYDTAGSAKIIKEKNLLDCAAIASDLAGKTYGLDILEANIEDHDNNYTRFLLLSRNPNQQVQLLNIHTKTHIAIAINNHQNHNIYDIINCFKSRNINIIKIESRPIPIKIIKIIKEAIDFNHRFPFIYHIEIEGCQYEDNFLLAIKELNMYSQYIRLFGCYPKYII